MIRKDTKDDIHDAGDAATVAVRSVLRDGKDAALNLADRIKDEAQSVQDTVMETASTLAADVTARVKDAATTAGEIAGRKVETAKDSIADEANRLAQTLRSSASDRGETVRARVLDAMAGGVETIADGVQGRSASTLYADVRTFAHRNPGVFVAGAAVAGFALARFLRSGATAEDRKMSENRT